MNTKELQRLFDAVLGPAGFQRRKETWYRMNEDTITLVNLQKSQWGGQYYVNLGVYLRDLGQSKSPPEYQCHIRARLTAIAGDERAAIEEALDLEASGIPIKQRGDVLRRGLADIAVPFLNERNVLPQLRELHARGQLDRGSVSLSKRARDLLERTPTITSVEGRSKGES
jgi:hypothetical protein